jgi:lipopolysaccharide transport system ATP-binding protein
MIAIHVENLSKRYRLGVLNSRTLSRDLQSWWARKRGKDDPNSKLTASNPATQFERGEYIWALRQINLEVKEGEAVGIIGRNGAGKSTLLKILSRVTSPTEGGIRIRGKVASLLEVGTGFHPDLTGRENVFLNASILGMTKKEVARKFDEIVEFAEVAQFIDTPVKRYSSGMYVRLAFAVAAHLDPEILIVDEVLAVGDALFQKKCLGKMQDVAQEGRTVLFVSHNMTAIQTFCDRAVWLENGEIKRDDESAKVVTGYLKTAFSGKMHQIWPDLEQAPGNEKVRIRKASLRPSSGADDGPITVSTPLLMEFEYWNLEPGAYIHVSLHIISESGVTAFNTAPMNESVWNGKPFPRGLFRSVCHIPGDLLNDGMHSVQLLIIKNAGQILFKMEDALVFEVRDHPRHGWLGKWPGAVRPNLEWTTELVNDRT